jgi:hypothetical protein
VPGGEAVEASVRASISCAKQRATLPIKEPSFHEFPVGLGGDDGDRGCRTAERQAARLETLPHQKSPFSEFSYGVGR